jgi:hypothetical protein
VCVCIRLDVRACVDGCGAYSVQRGGGGGGGGEEKDPIPIPAAHHVGSHTVGQAGAYCAVGTHSALLLLGESVMEQQSREQGYFTCS